MHSDPEVSQIESSFRDLKSQRYGHAFGDSLTRKRRRLDVLLLVNALASFAHWLAGLGCEATGIDQWLYPAKRRRKLVLDPARGDTSESDPCSQNEAGSVPRHFIIADFLPS